MGLISYDRTVRSGLVYCDLCDAILLPSGRHTPRSFRATTPVQLESLLRHHDEVIATARRQRWSESTAGVWSCFRCQSSSPAEAGCLQGRKILIADDDADSHRPLMDLLQPRGAACTVAGSGREALEVFVCERPDLVVADVRMPDTDGFDLIRRIRAKTPEEGGLVPAIAVSADGNTEQALMEGYHALLAKPVDAEALARLVEEFIHAETEVSIPPSSSFHVASPAPGRIMMTLTGYLGTADVRAGITALLGFLDEGPCRIVVDMRALTGFALAGASVAERVVWSKRHAVEHVRFVGGSLFARVAASAACRFLGIGCTIEDGGHSIGC